MGRTDTATMRDKCWERIWHVQCNAMTFIWCSKKCSSRKPLSLAIKKMLNTGPIIIAQSIDANSNEEVSDDKNDKEDALNNTRKPFVFITCQTSCISHLSCNGTTSLPKIFVGGHTTASNLRIMGLVYFWHLHKYESDQTTNFVTFFNAFWFVGQQASH